mgnify:CR=1 FL=1
MIGQYYSIRNPMVGVAVPGAFVFRSNSDDELIGFVYDSHDDVAEIVLFEPGELPDNIIESKAMPSGYADMLEDVIRNRASEEIKQMWAKACQNTEDE